MYGRNSYYTAEIKIDSMCIRNFSALSAFEPVGRPLLGAECGQCTETTKHEVVLVRGEELSDARDWMFNWFMRKVGTSPSKDGYFEKMVGGKGRLKTILWVLNNLQKVEINNEEMADRYDAMWYAVEKLDLPVIKNDYGPVSDFVQSVGQFAFRQAVSEWYAIRFPDDKKRDAYNRWLLNTPIHHAHP